MGLKQYNKEVNTYQAAVKRVQYTFDNFEKVYISFSGGKDSSVMVHLVMDEAIKRNRKVGILIIDLEAQYNWTISHIHEMVEEYKDHIELFWVCLPMSLRNAVSNFEPRWICWDDAAKDVWVRDLPVADGVINDMDFFPFFQHGMEFEEFMVLFGVWYGEGKLTAGFIGIRADESLNRFRTIASKTKETHGGHSFTTKVAESLYNIYPIYDWKTRDVWHYHAVNKKHAYNEVYNQMHKAGLTPHQMRLCQPYGDDQRRGLWLYHILEPDTWYKVVARVNGVNSGALYIEENGNITGYNKITKPEGHTWKSFCNLLLQTLPKKTRDHYIPKFQGWMNGWKGRGYDHIPDEAPRVLENKMWAPSWRRLCKVLLRNDYWCKGLGLTQPKSEAYKKYLQDRKEKRMAMEKRK
jgi:predicted phosphoadenosine phosphosulfate sulfurtransferase